MTARYATIAIGKQNKYRYRIWIFQHPKSITSSVDQSLEWKMLARWLSCAGQSMVEKRVEEISETTLDHVFPYCLFH